MINRTTIHEQIRAMGMGEAEYRFAIQDFERGEVIAELLLRAACFIRRSATRTGAVVRRFILTQRLMRSRNA